MVARRRGDTESTKSQDSEERRHRLASALRDNLARRKAQARARSEIEGRSGPQKNDTVSGRDGDG